jgi:hypothetical protein
MKPEAALVRPDRIIVLDTKAPVCPDLSGVVLPRDAERYDPVRFGQSLEDLQIVITGMVLEVAQNIGGHFRDCLNELGLPRIAFFNSADELGKRWNLFATHAAAPWIMNTAICTCRPPICRRAFWSPGSHSRPI